MAKGSTSGGLSWNQYMFFHRIVRSVKYKGRFRAAETPAHRPLRNFGSRAVDGAKLVQDTLPPSTSRPPRNWLKVKTPDSPAMRRARERGVALEPGRSP